MNEHADLWRQCASELREQVSEATWQFWFSRVVPLAYDGGVFDLGVPDRPIREKLESRFVPLIERSLSTVCQRDVKVRLRLVDHDVTPPQPNKEASRPAPPDPVGSGVPNHHETEVALDTRFTFETFVTASSNRLAAAAAQSVAEMPGRSYNPLFIYGDSGLGKTHLLHAIGNYVHQHFPLHRVVYLTAETLMNDFVDALQQKKTIQFKRRYRECDLLLIDDVQFLEEKRSLQEEFFHTYNDLHGAGKQIVVTSDRSPKSIDTLEDRLRSRFMSGLIAEIDPPDLETRLAILRLKAAADNLHVPQDVLEFIASHVKDNIRELEGALIRVSAHASLNKEERLTREVAERVLADLVSANQPRRVTPSVILEAVSGAYGFPVESLCGPMRTRPLVTARQVAMYVTRELTDYSFPAIGKVFGGRDHTTVIHAVNKVADQMRERPQIYEQVNGLIQQIKAGE